MSPIILGKSDGWYVLVPAGEIMGLDWLGPYSSSQIAEDRYWEWIAYVVEKGGCHVCDL